MPGKLVFLAAVMLSKVRDWSKNETRGWLPRREFDGLEVAIHWGDTTDAPTVSKYDAAIELLATGEAPLLRPDVDGTGWWIVSWAKFQPDPTALARKRKERADRWRALAAANGHGDKRDKANKGLSKARHGDKGSVSHRDNRDVTLRDEDVNETGRVRDEDEYEYESRQAGEEAGSAAPSPARPGAEAVAAPGKTNGVRRPGIAVHGGHKPEETPPNAVPPAIGAKRLLDVLSAPPSVPIRGRVDVGQLETEAHRVADPAKLERLKAEALVKIKELEERDQRNAASRSSGGTEDGRMPP